MIRVLSFVATMLALSLFITASACHHEAKTKVPVSAVQDSCAAGADFLQIEIDFLASKVALGQAKEIRTDTTLEFTFVSTSETPFAKAYQCGCPSGCTAKCRVTGSGMTRSCLGTCTGSHCKKCSWATIEVPEPSKPTLLETLWNMAVKGN